MKHYLKQGLNFVCTVTTAFPSRFFFYSFQTICAALNTLLSVRYRICLRKDLLNILCLEQQM